MLASLSGLQACQGPPLWIAGQLGDPALLKPAPPVTATELLDLRPQRAKATVILDDRPAMDIVVSFAQQPDGLWRLETRDIRRSYLQPQADGAIHIVREEQFADAVRVSYDPPLPMLPATLAAGKPFTGSSQIRATRLADGSPVDSGRCDYRIELLGVQAIRSLADTPDAFIVRTTRHIDLALADADVVLTSAFVPGRGVVAQRIVTATRMLGLIPVRHVEQMQRR